MPYLRTPAVNDPYARAESWTATDRGWLAENYPLGEGSGNSVLATAGRLELVKVKLPVAASVTNVLIYLGTAGGTLTAGQNFAALYTQAGARVGVTADQAAAWVSTGLKTMALVSGPFSLAAGNYYVGFWYNGTTAPSPIRNINNATQANAGTAAPTLLWCTADTGLTTTAPANFGAQTAQALSWWVALS